MCGVAAVAVAGVALMATPELAFAEVDPTAVTTTTQSAPSTDATTTTTDLPVLVPGTPGTTATTGSGSSGQSPDDGTTTTTQGGSVGLQDLVDSAVASEDGEPDDPADDAPLIDPGDDPSSNAQTVSASAEATQTGTGNGNVNVRVDDPGNGGPVGQENSASAVASGDATANQGSGAAGNQATGDQAAGNQGGSTASESDANSAGSASASTASASASASQTSPSNSNVVVRVGSEGDVGPTDQTNQASAAAAATGTGTSTGSATASAGQTSPHNVNVVVRVDSPGDNGPVNQTNNASASAGSSLPSQGTSSGPTGAAGPFGTDQEISTTGESLNVNDSSVGQQIEQTQDAAVPGNLPSATGSAQGQGGAPPTVGSASASQTGALNVNVSVRVGSPGSDGPVTQTNSATATGTSPSLGVVTQTGQSIDVSLVLPGMGPVNVGTNWAWNWTWDGTWTLPPTLTGELAPTNDAIWNWLWSNASNSTATPTATGAAGQSATKTGSWTWSWDWILPDGTPWSLDWTEACDCNWTWSWSWDWSKGAPASTAATDGAAAAADAETAEAAPEEFDPATDDGAVTQSNSVSAGAWATAALTTTSELDQAQAGSDPTLELQDAWALQRIQNSQTVEADATAGQTNAWNVNFVWGAPVESVLQTNEVEADAVADASADVTQYIVQDQAGNDETLQWVDAEQWVASSQAVLAVAQAAQTGVTNVNIVTGPSANSARVSAVEQSSTASALAYATVDATITQWIGQYQVGGVSKAQIASAVQLHSNAQLAIAVSQAAQTQLKNLAEARIGARNAETSPSVRQRHTATSNTLAWNTSVADAWILQSLGGTADVELADASQEGLVAQSSLSQAVALQTGNLNHSLWIGPEVPLPPVAEDEPEAPVATTTVTQQSSTFFAYVTKITKFKRQTRHTTTSKHPHRKHVELPMLVSLPLLGSGPAVAQGPGTTPGATVPGSGATAPYTFPSPFEATDQDAPSAASSSASSKASTTSKSPAQPRAEQRPFEPLPLAPYNWAGFGASGFAPLSGGSGPLAALARPYKFAAPAHIGPHVPTPTLGLSVAFLEPFERPG
jgi:hypothetical protein